MSAIFYKNLPYGAGGSNVEANPSGSATDDLEKIGIDGTVYDVTDADAVHSADKGVANGVASLDATGRVPSTQLPSYVDDVLEYASLSAFPATGESGKIYIALDTNKTYRWSGSAYVEISESLALGTTHSTAAYGDDAVSTAEPSFSEASTRANLAGSGEKLSVIFGKIKKWFTDLKDLAFIGKDGASSTKYLRGDGTWQAFPTIPTVNNKTLTIQKNGTQVAQFTANSASDVTANITVPTGDLASVNKPSSGQTTSYLRGDGTWQNFPTIPAAQVQSDWNQTNTSAVDYIKNKPNRAGSSSDGGSATKADRLVGADARSVNSPPSYYINNHGDAQIVTQFKSRSTVGAPGSASYGTVITVTPWHDASGGLPVQMWVDNSGHTAIRYATDSSTWGAWNEVATTGNAVTGVKGDNESSYRTGNVNITAANVKALPLAGGTMTGTIVTPADYNKGIEPATTNYGYVGSSSKKYYTGYINNLYTYGIYLHYPNTNNKRVAISPDLLSRDIMLIIPDDAGSGTTETLATRQWAKTLFTKGVTSTAVKTKTSLGSHTGMSFSNLFQTLPSVTVPSGYSLFCNVNIEVSGSSGLSCAFDGDKSTTTSNINGFAFNAANFAINSGVTLTVRVTSIFIKN